jgi:methionyl-tRNA formyltransferase
MTTGRSIVFFGSGAFGVPTLAALSKQFAISAIVTQPDRPAGRGSKLTPTPIAAWASEHLPNVTVYKPEKVNQPELVASLRAAPAEAWVVIAFGQKLGKSLLDGKFAINLHGSILPRWRGAAPINAAILAGDPVAGNTVITLADKMDAGLVLGISRREVSPLWTAGELHDLLSQDGPDLVLDVLAKQFAGTLVPQVQDESLVTLAAKMSKNDGWIRPADGAEACRRRVHGLTPWPGVSAMLAGEAIKLLRVCVDPEHSSSAPAGTLVNREAGAISCGAGPCLRLMEVQPAGKRGMAWSDFARGRSLTDGVVLTSSAPAATGDPSC